MKKIKCWCWKLLSFGSRHKLLMIAVSAISLIICSLFYGVVFGKLWLKFPETWQAHIAINRLGVSSYNDLVCHENCYYERRLYKQIIARNLEKSKIGSRVEGLILDEENNLNFRLELLDALAFRDNLELPDYLNNYLITGKSGEVRKKIRELFGVNNLSADELVNRLNNSSSTDDQIDTLNLLREKSDSSLADYYVDLIVSDSDLSVKNSALLALSNLDPSDNYISVEFLSRIKNIIFNQATNQYLRKELVLLLGSYLPVQEKAITKILVEVYIDEKVIDKFSRLFAADILNSSSANNYVKPEISESEWQEYRDNNSLWGND